MVTQARGTPTGGAVPLESARGQILEDYDWAEWYPVENDDVLVRLRVKPVEGPADGFGILTGSS